MKDKTIVNQQEILTPAEKGWLTAIIEGEGSITMSVRRKKWNGWKGIGVDMTVVVMNTDAGIIKRFSDILEKLGIIAHIYEYPASPIHKKNGMVYRSKKTVIHASTGKMRDILKILTATYPHFAGDKKHRASLMIDFIKRRINRKGKHTNHGASWYDGYDWNLVKKFYDITGGKLLPEVKEFLREHTPSPIKG